MYFCIGLNIKLKKRVNAAEAGAWEEEAKER